MPSPLAPRRACGRDDRRHGQSRFRADGARDVGGEEQRPLATVVIGGLITFTLLTLVLGYVTRCVTKRSSARASPQICSGKSLTSLDNFRNWLISESCYESASQ